MHNQFKEDAKMIAIKPKAAGDDDVGAAVKELIAPSPPVLARRAGSRREDNARGGGVGGALTVTEYSPSLAAEGVRAEDAPVWGSREASRSVVQQHKYSNSSGSNSSKAYSNINRSSTNNNRVYSDVASMDPYLSEKKIIVPINNTSSSSGSIASSYQAPPSIFIPTHTGGLPPHSSYSSYSPPILSPTEFGHFSRVAMSGSSSSSNNVIINSNINSIVGGVGDSPTSGMQSLFITTSGLEKDRKSFSRMHQQECTQRKAEADTEFFWDCVRNFSEEASQDSGSSIGNSNNNSIRSSHYSTNSLISGEDDGAAHVGIGGKRQLSSTHPSPRPTLAESSNSSSSSCQECPAIESVAVQFPFYTSDSTDGELHPSIVQFSELENLDSVLHNNLTRMGVSRPTPFQSKVVPILMAGHNAMCLTLLGSGKTVAYLVPAVSSLLQRRTSQAAKESAQIAQAADGKCEEGETTTTNSSSALNSSVDASNSSSRFGGVYPRVLIITPTRELALQILQVADGLCHDLNVRSSSIYGGSEFRMQLFELARGCDILIGTPGRIGDLLERGILHFEDVFFLTLDEIERLVSMGFKPKLQSIINESDMPSKASRQTVIYSSPISTNALVWELAEDLLGDYATITCDNKLEISKHVTQILVKAPADIEERAKLLFEIIKTDGEVTKKILVFVKCKSTANWICQTLLFDYAIPTDQIHGNSTQIQRSIALRKFKEGTVRVLVSTNVASRGLSLPKVDHVVQFDMPTHAEDFNSCIYRISRAYDGKITSFYVPGIENGNGRIYRLYLNLLTECKQEIPQWFLDLDSGAGHSSAETSFSIGGDFYGGSVNIHTNSNSSNNSNINSSSSSSSGGASYIKNSSHSYSSNKGRTDNSDNVSTLSGQHYTGPSGKTSSKGKVNNNSVGSEVDGTSVGWRPGGLGSPFVPYAATYHVPAPSPYSYPVSYQYAPNTYTTYAYPYPYTYPYAYQQFPGGPIQQYSVNLQQYPSPNPNPNTNPYQQYLYQTSNSNPNRPGPHPRPKTGFQLGVPGVPAAAVLGGHETTSNESGRTGRGASRSSLHAGDSGSGGSSRGLNPYYVDSSRSNGGRGNGNSTSSNDRNSIGSGSNSIIASDSNRDSIRDGGSSNLRAHSALDSNNRDNNKRITVDLDPVSQLVSKLEDTSIASSITSDSDVELQRQISKEIHSNSGN